MGPHRQFVFTVPKVLRLLFRRNRTLFAQVSRLLNQLISDFYNYATGRTIRSGMIAAHQTFGDMLRWNPHFHCIVLEDGFDEDGKFFYLKFLKSYNDDLRCNGHIKGFQDLSLLT